MLAGYTQGAFAQVSVQRVFVDKPWESPSFAMRTF